MLVGLGARKLSMSGGNIAGVKAKLAECTLQELTALAEKTMIPLTKNEMCLYS